MKLDYGRPWTPEEEARLRLLISARLRPHEIAVKLHRTVQAVYRRAQKLRLSFKRPLLGS
jgi:DNA invertase Pin-like site-specific DNA recombinase